MKPLIFDNNVNSVLVATLSRRLFRTFFDNVFIDIWLRVVAEHIIFRSRDQQIDGVVHVIYLHNCKHVENLVSMLGCSENIHRFSNKCFKAVASNSLNNILLDRVIIWPHTHTLQPELIFNRICLLDVFINSAKGVFTSFMPAMNFSNPSWGVFFGWEGRVRLLPTVIYIQNNLAIWFIIINLIHCNIYSLFHFITSVVVLRCSPSFQKFQPDSN